MEDFVEVSGLLYKRRGGFGKMMPHAWQQRYFFCSKDGFLYYFDTEGPEALRSLNDSIAKDVDACKSRGKIDLKSSHCEFSCESSIDSSGAPTQFIILIVPSNGEEKWKLCASNSDDFNKWTKSINMFALHDKPSNKSRINSNVVNDPVVNDLKTSPSSSSIEKGNMKIKGDKLKLGSNSSSSFDFVELCLTVLIMNICYYYVMTNTSRINQMIYSAIANVVVIKTLMQRNQRKSESSDEPKASVSDPLNYASNIKIDEPPVEEIIVKHPPPGITFNEVFTSPNSSQAHTWCKCDHKLFNVRIGPDYNRFRKKAPSVTPLFEPFAVDVFCTNRRVDHASRFFSIPKELLELETNHPHVPPVYVVQIQIPSDPPASMFTTVEDGPGWAILMYFKITEDTTNQLKNMDTASPAIKLFAQYCEKCQDDQHWRARFKVIASCSNLDEMGFPQFITSYNAKPVVIRRTGTIFKGKGYIEKDIHVHKFANVAKSSIHLLSSRCSLMYMQIGFVIEGRADDELPETLFGCVAINKPEEDRAETAANIFQ